jgi:glycine cleavage system H lipoate-binding protein
MSESLVFMMGEFAAELPADRLYVKNHMWALPGEDGTVRFGFSAYAVRLLQDIYFIDFDCAPGSLLTNRQEFGSIESKKAESGLYSPIGGEVVASNEQMSTSMAVDGSSRCEGIVRNCWMFKRMSSISRPRGKSPNAPSKVRRIRTISARQLDRFMPTRSNIGPLKHAGPFSGR